MLLKKIRPYLLSISLIAALGAAVACTSTTAVDLRDESEQLQTDSSGNGGAGGAMSFVDCSEDVAPSGGSCEPSDPSSLCQACVEVQCCELQTECNSTSPNTACAFGSTLFEGRAIEGGEIGCMMECFAQRKASDTLEGSTDDVAACALLCAASECGEAQASATTAALAACILGVDGLGGDGCANECGFAL